MCFINTVVQTAHGPNAKVFHQYEFLEAGFSVQEIEKSLHGRQDERVLHELREWGKNFIDIQQFMDDLAVARGRARDLKEDVRTELIFSLCSVECALFVRYLSLQLEVTQRRLQEANMDRENQFEQIKRVTPTHKHTLRAMLNLLHLPYYNLYS